MTTLDRWTKLDLRNGEEAAEIVAAYVAAVDELDVEEWSGAELETAWNDYRAGNLSGRYLLQLVRVAHQLIFPGPLPRG